MRLIDAESPYLLDYISKMKFENREDIRRMIEAQPTAESRPKGKWIHQTKFSRIECTNCGQVYRNAFAPKNYCPNCGADMREE